MSRSGEGGSRVGGRARTISDGEGRFLQQLVKLGNLEVDETYLGDSVYFTILREAGGPGTVGD